jgi:glycosyltransferase involved in cell wall biosynthesis
MTTRIKALIVAHDARATGGVNNFLRIMRRKMRKRVDALRFANGRRHGENGRLATLRRLLWDYLRFCILLSRKTFDVVHLNPTLDLSSLPREMVFVWLSRAFQPKAKVLLFFRGWDWTALAKIQQTPWKRRLFLATLKRVDRILLLSSGFKQALVDEGISADCVRVVSTMFEGDALSAAYAKKLERRPHLLVFMSRFMPAKGGALVLEAFADILKEYPAAELVMAGDGPDRPRLEQLSQSLALGDRVSFPGYMLGESKMALLTEASLFVLPTKHPEGMPNAILEAMAAGNVVISTDVGGIKDVVTDGDNGVILEVVDAKALARAISGYFARPDQMQETRERNVRKAWANWESAIVADRIADHYADLRT